MKAALNRIIQEHKEDYLDDLASLVKEAVINKHPRTKALFLAMRRTHERNHFAVYRGVLARLCHCEEYYEAIKIVKALAAQEPDEYFSIIGWDFVYKRNKVLFESKPIAEYNAYLKEKYNGE